jgi:hypothetical protein
MDRLDYGDQTFTGTPRTQNVSANIPFASLGTNNILDTVLSANGDTYSSYANSGGDIGNPGIYAPIPEPATVTLVALGGWLAIAARRGRARRQ